MRIADGLGPRHTQSGRLLFHYCSGGTLQFSKYGRLEPGGLRAPSRLSAFEMSPTGTWAPFELALW